MACVFTSSGAAARKFRYEAEAGNIGINIGVAAPMAFFPFSGWKNSFFGTCTRQGKHAVEFFTQTKVVVERWLEANGRGSSNSLDAAHCPDAILFELLSCRKGTFSV